MKNALVVLMLMIVVASAGVAWKVFSFMSPAGHDPARKIIVDVLPGQSFREVVFKLEKEGVIEDAREFLIFLRLTGKSSALKVGEYELEFRQPPRAVLGILSSGKSLQRQFTIPEGYNIYEIAELLSNVGFGDRRAILSILKDSDWASQMVGERVETIEGYLFPETYSYTKHTPLAAILGSMVELFHKNYSEIHRGRDIGLSKHEIVTLASIIEKETGAPRERGLVASVFFNRLKKGMRLQTDPTIVYGILDQTGEAPDRIRTRHIRGATRYNTYTISGLPPGPIASPGRASLEATFEPTPSDYFYFVSRNDGTHIFSRTYREHNEAVQKYQVRREGP